MKVYRVRYQFESGWANEWFATKAEAKQATKEIKDEKGDEAVVGPELIDIPTDKKGLVRWLNLWHGGDDL